MNPTPYVMSLEPGSYYFCACGRSANLPFCDGTHQGSGVEPFAVDIAEPQTVAICACRHSANRPFCDGTHKDVMDASPYRTGSGELQEKGVLA